FFAMIARPLTTRRGENTSAAWGITNFLIRLLDRRRPDYFAWVHDVGESFRQQAYPAYKATREKLTAELQQEFDRSVERIEQILAAFRVPVVGVEGYEADDVIGTLAIQAASRGVQVVIVSGDKDFYQLIGPRIALLNPGRGGPAAVEEHWVDETNASERLGVPPTRVTDYLALVGDTSDNVPGVKGVGEKTALELLRTFGDPDALAAVVAECRRARLVALDTETSALDPMRAEIVGMSLAVAPGRSWYLPFAHVAPDGALAGGTPPRNLPPPASEAIAPLRELLSEARVPKAAHNIKYDWLVPRRAGIELAGVVYDSLLASFVLDPGRRSHAINDLARERLSLEMRTYADVAGRGRAERPFAAVPVADAARYSCGDSEVVLRLRE